MHVRLNLGFFPGISSYKRQKVDIDEICIL